MHDATSHVATPRSSVVQGVHRQASLHPGVYGVAEDTTGERVLDGAEVELALVDPVPSDVGKPELVDVIRGDVAPDQVVVDRGSGALTVLTALLAEDRPPLVVPTDLPRCSLAHHLASDGGFICEESVAERRVVATGIPSAASSLTSGGGTSRLRGKSLFPGRFAWER